MKERGASFKGHIIYRRIYGLTVIRQEDQFQYCDSGSFTPNKDWYYVDASIGNRVRDWPNLRFRRKRGRRKVKK